jgi:acylphosphatase
MSILVKARAHVFVGGRVQGVFFRQTTQQKAQGFGVKGWVRNLLDGRVEAVFEGEENAIKELVDFSRKGPKGALVTDFSVDWETFANEFDDFKIV